MREETAPGFRIFGNALGSGFGEQISKAGQQDEKLVDYAKALNKAYANTNGQNSGGNGGSPQPPTLPSDDGTLANVPSLATTSSTTLAGTAFLAGAGPVSDLGALKFLAEQGSGDPQNGDLEPALDLQDPKHKRTPDLFDVTKVSPDQPKGIFGSPSNLDGLAIKLSNWEIAHNPGTGPIKDERGGFIIDSDTGNAVPGKVMEGDSSGVATRKSAGLLPEEGARLIREK